MSDVERSGRGLALIRTTRSQPYLFLVGMVVGSLVTAFILPFTKGPPVREERTLVGGSAGDPLTPGITGVSGAAVDGGGSTGTNGRTAAGPGRGQPTGPGSNGGVAPSDGGSATGPVVGVTDTQIKVGYLLLDTGSLSRIGVSVPGVDPKQQKQAFEAFMKDVNSRGGIHGRKLVGVYENFDVLSQDDMRRACLALRDEKVFAAVAAGGYQGPALLCVTEEGRTPLFNMGTHGTPTEYIRRSEGRLVTMFQHSDRLMLNWVAELHAMGVLKGKQIGITSQETTNPGDTVVGGGLIPAFKRFGYKVSHVSRFSGDQSTAAGQVPVEVSQMQRKGVDIVLLTTSTLASSGFVQTANNQGYRPRYSLTDWASMNNDTSNQSMPESYNGTIGITTYRVGEERIGIGESAEEKRCRAVYEKHAGRKLAAKGHNEYGLTQGNCTTVTALFKAAELAGPALTRETLVAGVQEIGIMPMTMWGGGSFGPNKFDAADPVRTVVWKSDCRCLMPTTGFRKNRF